jgi:predicted nucleic acid-binding protein
MVEMVKKLNLNAEIPPNRELHITLPNDVPSGPAEIVLVVSSSTRPSDSTLGALAGSDFFGLWKDRPDITDSFAQTLRSEGWKRSA